jgi:RNA polymerase sigma-70 factor (ECF subfamily)
MVEMSIARERSDGDLLAGVVAGDGAAFSVFYRRHLAGVVGYLLRETRDRELAADLAAEVFAAVFLVAGRFRARGDGSAAMWVRGIAQNKLRDSRRRGRVEDRARRRLAFEPEPLTDEDLARVEELAGADGRGVLGLVVRQQVSRGLKRLRDQLAEGER